MRHIETSVPISKGDYEDTFFYSETKNIYTDIFGAMMDYVTTSDRDSKSRLGRLLLQNWNKLPKRTVQLSGSAFRIWIFGPKKAGKVLERLENNEGIKIDCSDFLSFTAKLPSSPSTFKKYWSVLKTNSECGSVVLVQKCRYKKGFSVTDFLEWLRTAGYFKDSDETDDYSSGIMMDVDDSLITLMNQEQEVFVFDSVLDIHPKEVVNIKVAVKPSSPLPGLLIPRTGVKFVEAPDTDHAKEMLGLNKRRTSL
jgi:hypothetical protein